MSAAAVVARGVMLDRGVDQMVSDIHFVAVLAIVVHVVADG